MKENNNLDKDLYIERQKAQMFKDANDKLIQKLQEMVDTTRNAKMDDLNKLSRSLSDAVKELKTKVETSVNSNKKEVDDSIEQLNKKLVVSLGEVEDKIKNLDELSYNRINEIADELSADIEGIRKSIPSLPDLSGIKNDITQIKQNISEREEKLKKGIESEINNMANKIPKIPTAEELVAILRTVKKQWLSIEAIDGDFNAKVTKQFGGGNTRPLDVFANGTYVGGVREIDFIGGGVSTELDDSGTRMIITIAGGLGNLVDDEVPTGAKNGSNTAFTLDHTPSPATSLKVFLNGQKLTLTEDYSLSDDELTMVVAPESDDILTVDYRY